MVQRQLTRYEGEEDFKKRYFAELEHKQGILGLIIEKLEDGVTLLYSTRDQQHNNASALKEYLENMTRDER